ncbi:adipokinetic hormone/corazonin-related peptide receptor variant I-like [Paramacrobiotus metropolitanus]|uniref:adipokinetic hormone/corazonin-related peptide receptor variant I-like n=1 Tax=Paramacrobiotus metropolitanus TaxID=2943436 RepID=UPI002445BA84|nr:adipokinetic hormone/corazonin-related peptide receptor variant I-like [Paramacrobiotus metropolitanus]
MAAETVSKNSSLTDGEPLFDELYEEIFINSNYKGTILTITVLMVGLTANFTFLWSLFVNTNPRSRLRPFLVNLAIADLIICIFTLGLELGWRLTVVWIAGDVTCRMLKFMDTLGLYLEAFIVVTMSVDRCYVVLWPLRIRDQAKRTKMLVIGAWIAAVLFSFPQVIVFHVESHHEIREFTQCVSINSFSSPAGEKAYVLFGILSLYAIPLVVIVSVNVVLLLALHSFHKCQTGSQANCGTNDCASSGAFHAPKPEYVHVIEKTGNTRSFTSPMSSAFERDSEFSPYSESSSKVNCPAIKPLRVRINTGMQLCHTNTSIRKQARLRTFKLSLLILMAFVLCNTPYAVMICHAFMNLHQDLDQNEADPHLFQQTDALLMWSLSFSTIMNPFLYGFYILLSRKRCRNIMQCLCKRKIES